MSATAPRKCHTFAIAAYLGALGDLETDDDVSMAVGAGDVAEVCDLQGFLDGNKNEVYDDQAKREWAEQRRGTSRTTEEVASSSGARGDDPGERRTPRGEDGVQRPAPRWGQHTPPSQPGRGKSLKKKAKTEPLVPLETIAEAPAASGDEAGADIPPDDALLQLCVVGPNGEVKVLDRVPVGNDTTALYREVGRATGIPVGELKLVHGVTVILMSVAARI